MSKRITLLVAVIMLAALVLGACQSTPKSECAKEDVFCVGLVTDVGKIDDKSFNQSAWEGVQQAEAELGATVKYIETTDSKDYDKNISSFADEDYDVIVTVGFALGEATVAAAKEYPNTNFIGVDQAQAEEVENLAGLIFNEDQAGFLAGVLAASLSEAQQIGAVLGTDAVPAVWRFGEGYRAGALYTNPDIEINVVYHNDVGFDKTFTDPEWGKTTALSMIDKGVDVVFGAGGKTGNGALMACAEKDTYAIGVDADQYYTVPEAQSALVSSAMKLLTPGTFDLIKLAQDGNFPSGDFYGEVGLAPFHDLDGEVPPPVRDKLEEVRQGLLDGSIDPGVAPAKPAE